MANEKKKRENLKNLILLAVNTVLFFSLYRILLYYAEMTDDTYWSFLVMMLYTALLLGFALAYLIYNRFFYKKGVTREQLCADWSEEEKDAFLADGEARIQKSKWMLTIIFPLVVTFLIDAVDLFIIDTFL